jgi:pimeloyl-ACP methyl ester carboxylesterase
MARLVSARDRRSLSNATKTEKRKRGNFRRMGGSGKHRTVASCNREDVMPRAAGSSPRSLICEARRGRPRIRRRFSMSSIGSRDIHKPRRQFLGASTILSAAAALWAMPAKATPQASQTADRSPPPRAKHPTFSALKQIDAGALSVGYAEEGPAGGRPVLLLHGWPYDIHTYVDVAPLLAARGYRVIVPYLRGYGSTRFLSDVTPRNAQQAAIAVDAIALLDALGIKQAIVAGCDWGARTANILATLWPNRCKAMVSVSGYLIGSRERNKAPLTPSAEHGWWYQFYFATERGRAGYAANTREFAQLIWQLASPRWSFDAPIFDRTAAALANSDHVDIVVHNYRWRLGLADGETQYDDLEDELARFPPSRAERDFGRGCERCPPPKRRRLRQDVLRKVRAPRHRRRRGAQPSTGGSARICAHTA